MQIDKQALKELKTALKWILINFGGAVLVGTVFASISSYYRGEISEDAVLAVLFASIGGFFFNVSGYYQNKKGKSK